MMAQGNILSKSTGQTREGVILCHSEGHQNAGEMGQQESSQQGNAKSCTGDEHYRAPVQLEADHVGSSFAEENL